MPWHRASSKMTQTGPRLHDFLPWDRPGTLSTLSNIAQQPGMTDTRGMKRTVQVNVKTTQEDFNILRRPAKRRSPDAVITNSGNFLAFAELEACEVLAKTKGSNYVIPTLTLNQYVTL